MRILFIIFLLSGYFGLSTSLVNAQKKNKKTSSNPEQASEEYISSQSKRSENEYLFSEGMKHYIMEEYAKALTKFQLVLNDDPGKAGVHFQVAMCYLQLGDYNPAEINIKKAISLDNTNIHFYLTAARLYTIEEKYNELIAIYKAILENFPSRKEYYYDLGNAYFKAGKSEDAIQAFNQMETYFGPGKLITNSKQKIYLANNQVDKAIQEGKKLIEAQPFEKEFQIDLAQLLLKNNRYDEALPILEKIASSYTPDFRVNYALATLYLKKGDANKSLEAFGKAMLSSEPDIDTKASYFKDYISSLPAENDKGVLEVTLKQLLKDYPENNLLNQLYADYFLSKGSESNTLPYYLNAVRSDPSQKELWEKILLIELKKQMADSASRHAEEALEVFPNYAPFWYYYGVAQSQKKQYDEAFQSLEEALKLAFNNKDLLAEIHSQMAEIYFSKKEFEKSEVEFRKAVESNPEKITASSLEHYGDALYQLKQVEKAIEQWKKSRSKGNSSPELEKKINEGKISE